MNPQTYVCLPAPIRSQLKIVLTPMHDDTERTTDMAPPPTDTEPSARDRDTEPPGPDEVRSLATMLPGILPRALSEPVRDQSIDQLLRMYEAARQREHDLLDSSGKLAQLHEERAKRIKGETVAELSDVVDRIAGRPIRALAERIDSLANDVQSLRKNDAEHDKRLADIEARDLEFRDMRSALTALTLRLEQYEAAEPDAKLLEGRSILIVENEVALVSALSRMAASRGASVMTATSLAETKTVISTLVPDLALVDIMLGQDNGFAVADYLHEIHGMASERIVLMSGHVDHEQERQARRRSLRIVSKPFGTAELVAAILSGLNNFSAA